jgi:hypothetical protein
MFNESEKEGIKVEAQALLKRFGDRLAKLDLKEPIVNSKESGMRRMGKNTVSVSGFREKIFANAPQKEGNFIIAERKKW